MAKQLKGFGNLLSGKPSKPIRDIQQNDEANQVDVSAEQEAPGLKTSKRGRPSKTDGTITACFVVDPDKWAKVQTIARVNGVQIKTLLDKVLGEYIDGYEQRNGEVTPISSNLSNL